MASRPLFGPESIKRGVSYSIALSFVAKGLGFLVQMFIVYRFGAGTATDIYFWGLALVLAVSGLVGSLNVSVIVPHGIHLLNTEGMGALNRFLGGVTRRILLVSLLITALMVFFPLELTGLISKFDPDRIREHAGLIRLLFLALPFVLLSIFFSDVFSIYRTFSAVVAIEAAKHAVFLILFLILSSVSGENSMAWALLGSSIAHLTVLMVVLKPRLGTLFPWSTGDEIPRKLRHDAGYALLGQSTSFGFTAYVAYLISGFTPGVYSAMNYGLSLMSLIQMIFIVRLSNIAGIYFMDLHSRGRMAELGTLFQKYLQAALMVFMVAAPLLAFFSDGIVALVFERGKFHAENTRITSAFFRLFALSLPLILVDMFVTQVVFAARKVSSSLYLQMVYNLVNIAAVGLLIGRMGYLGYPTGLLVVRICYLFVLWLYVRKVFPFLDLGIPVRYLLKTAAVAGVLAAATYPLRANHPLLHVLAFPALLLLSTLIWTENRPVFSKVRDAINGRRPHVP